MINATVKLDKVLLDQLKSAAPGQITSALITLGYMGEADAKMSMSTSSPSAPGDPPGVRTGALRAGIHMSQQGPSEVWIVSSVEYDMFLELGTSKMAARPFMGPMAKRLEKEIPGVFKKAVEGAF